jgi:tRNA-splicing ligase RtcB
MMDSFLNVLWRAPGLPPFTASMEAVNCHHNYVNRYTLIINNSEMLIQLVREYHFGKDLFVTRKGAVSAKKGELGIIPGSMGAKSYIVRGACDQLSLRLFFAN